MELTQLPRWDEVKHLISSLREKIVIDCGHVTVRYADQQYIFGGADGLSQTALSTFTTGVALYRHLKAQGYHVKLNICLSDTSRLLGSNNKRSELLAAITEKKYSICLPTEYLEQLSSSDVDDLVVMLQTRNSNRFSNLIKKMKGKVKKTSSPDDLYHELNGVFLKSHDGDQFAISTPFLMDDKGEEERISYPTTVKNQEDLMAINCIKEAALIMLYQKSIGPLCPATYGGLLLHYDESYDHICLYSRNDDRYITEKILRGTISANVLKKDFSRTCVQIVFPEFSTIPELYSVNSADFKKYRPPLSHFTNHLERREVFDAMSFYGK